MHTGKIGCLALLLCAPAAMADPITELVNTGYGLHFGEQDTNYALTVLSGDTTGLGQFGYVASGWPSTGPWLVADTTVSQWLTPFVDTARSLDPTANGLYDWQFTFELPMFSAASLAGRWAADNSGIVLLNGVRIGSTNGFSSWSTFSTQEGFVAGINTLDFLVTNSAQSTGNPTGLRVEFTSSDVTASPVPEPASMALMTAGIGLWGAMARRRRSRRIKEQLQP